MQTTSITSAQNASLKRIRALHDRSAREKESLFLIEGPKLLNEALAKHVSVVDVVASKSFWLEGMPHLDQAQIETVSIVEDKLFKELMTTQTSCGVIAVARFRDTSLDECLQGARTLLVIGEGLQDPGNVGTLIRAALAFGASGLALIKGSVDPYNPKVVRSAMGALFALPVVLVDDLAELFRRLKEESIRIVALETHAEHSLHATKLTGPIAILLGNEGNGLSTEARSFADELARIPISPASESLNVAVCGSIVLYQCAVDRGAIFI